MSYITPSRLIESSCLINENLNSTSMNDKSATCLLKLTVEEANKNSEDLEKDVRKNYLLDLPPETLNTLLDGLVRIREQLSNVAQKQ